MSEDFDPYYVWLGIPPHEQPPDHYRLLGIALFESQPDVIASAADRQTGHLRTFQTGKHSDVSQRLLNEVAAARVCLLNPAKKAAYDGRLQDAYSAAVQTVTPHSTHRAPSFISSNEPHLAPPPIQQPFPPRLTVDIAAPVSSLAARVRRGKRDQKRRFLRGTFSLVQVIVGGVVGLAAACFILSLVYPEHPIVVGVREFFHPANPTKNPVEEPPDLPLRKPPGPLRNREIERQTAKPPQPEPRPILLEPPKQLTVDLGTGVKLEMVLIPAGEFLMGSGESAEAAAKALKRYESRIKPTWFGKEYPQHQVRITQPFYLGQYEVTVGQFREFVSQIGYRTDAEKDGKGGHGLDAAGQFEQKPQYTWRNPGFPQTDEHPVVNVSWNDAVAFCDWLSKKEGKGYRLPTEAEWEYACRAGTATRYYNGDDPESLHEVGNVADAAIKAKFSRYTWTTARRDGYVCTAPVGQFRANAFGLYDTHGNVWEMCSDWYADYYRGLPATDPQGPTSGEWRVCRGGAWSCNPRYTRSVFRGIFMPAGRISDIGFRVAMTPSRPDTKLPPSPEDIDTADKKVEEIAPIGPPIPPNEAAAGNGDSRPQPKDAPEETVATSNRAASETEQQSSSPKHERLPMPGEEEQAEIARRLDDIFNLAEAKSRDDRRNLALEMFKAAGKVADPAERFVLLRKTTELASDGGDAALMLQAVDSIGDAFDIDVRRVQCQVMATFGEKAQTVASIKSMVDVSHSLVEELLAEERYDLALELTAAVYKACLRSGSQEFRKEAFDHRREVEVLHDPWQKAQQARSVLESDPGNAEAHLVLGRWYCFTKNSWAEGLPHLAECADEKLQALARKELRSPPSDPEEQVRLGDEWWELGQTCGEKEKEAILLRAGYWYEQARPGIQSELSKAKVDKRLEEIAVSNPSLPASQQSVPTDWVRIVNPKTGTVIRLNTRPVRIEPAGQFYKLRSQDGRYVGLADWAWNGDEGAGVQGIFRYGGNSGRPYNLWQFEPCGNGCWTITNCQSKKCLEAPREGHETVWQSTFRDGALEQQWRLEVVARGE